MVVAIFIYNILLIVLYSVTLTFVINHFLKDRNKLFLAMMIFLSFFIFDNVIIYMTEFIHSFASSYDQSFMNVPLVKTTIFLANAYCSFWIVHQILKEKFKPLHYGIIAIMAAWMLLVPLMKNSAFEVWLYYLSNQLMLFYLGSYSFYRYKKSPDLSETTKYYLKRIAILCMVSAICILAEDTFVIFNVDQYTSLVVKIYNRNICEDIYSILACALMLRYFIRDYNLPIEVIEDNSQDEQCEAFCQHYQLTQREAEIFKLLLEHQTNQEIADTLFLSIGTVKTHVHNIFIKLEINKRNQIFSIYEKFTMELGNQRSA